jgi:hypothetical protein
METFIKYKNLELDEIYSQFMNEYNQDSILIEHRTYVENNNLGFGEKPFHVVWRELVKSLPNKFKFLEIGVYKGQVLSLIPLLSKIYQKDVEFIGVTPLSSHGDKYSSYDKTSYDEVIKSIFNKFDLPFDINKNILIGNSTTEEIKTKIKENGIYDLIYIDGCHDYDCVVSDINLMKEVSVKESYIVFDDSSCYKNFSTNLFKGHEDVCKAIRDLIETDSETFEEIICVGHNRVFKRIK